MTSKIFFPVHCINSSSGILYGHYQVEKDSYHVITIVSFEQFETYVNSSCSVLPLKYKHCKPIGLWQSQLNPMKIITSSHNIHSERWPVLHQYCGTWSIFFIQPNIKQVGDVNALLSLNCALFLYERQDICDGCHLLPSFQEFQKNQLFFKNKNSTIGVRKPFFYNSFNIKFLFNNIADFEMVYFLYCKVTAFMEKSESKPNVIQEKAIFVTFKFYQISCCILKFFSCTHKFTPKVLLIAWHPLIHALKKCLQLSSVGSQMILKVQLLSKLRSIKKTGYIFWANLILAFFFDMLFGAMFCYLVFSSAQNIKICIVEVFMPSVDYIANQVEDLIQWLMGIPIGLKLNSPLNHFLGNFFLHHVRLWLDYLRIILSVISSSFNETNIVWPMYLGCFGFSFFIAFLSDVMSILTFHIYCFYVYAARLYGLQVTGLMSFWRLFRGKKWNPLRNRVDTLPHSPDVADHRFYTGTLFFTMLLFLFPTTALYYAIFAVLRVATLCLQVILQWFQKMVACFPWYTAILRTTRPCSFPVCARFNQTNVQTGNLDWVEALRCPKHLQKVHVENLSILRMLFQVQSYQSAISTSLKEMNSVFSESYKFRDVSTCLLTGKLIKWM